MYLYLLCVNINFFKDKKRNKLQLTNLKIVVYSKFVHVKVLYYTISCIELFLRFHYILLADYPNQDLARYVLLNFVCL